VLSADLEGTAAEGLGHPAERRRESRAEDALLSGRRLHQELAEHLHIAPYIVEGIFQRLRKDQLMQAIGLAAGGHR
jgi:hypothetical protein